MEHSEQGRRAVTPPFAVKNVTIPESSFTGDTCPRCFMDLTRVHSSDYCPHCGYKEGCCG